MKPNYLPATISEIEILLPFMQEFYEHERLSFDEAILHQVLQQILSNDFFGCLWLIEIEGEKVGYTALTFGFSLEFQGRDAFVDELYIRENFRGRGVGQATIDFLAETCRRRGIRALHLEVDHINTIAQELYRKKDFKAHDRFLMTKWL